MSGYHCPNCGKDISFGEAICPNCKADVTSVWEQASGPKKETPKIIPGTGGMVSGNSPFPPPANSSPFPPAAGNSPFPPPSGNSPFPPPSGNTPFPPPANSAPFPPPSGSASFPPPTGSAPFPPQVNEEVKAPSSNAYFEIPRIGGILNIPDNQSDFFIGRDEIQGSATKALPDLNAYNNLSKVRKDGSGKVYKEHFIIHNKKGEYSIEDIHSTNGTYLGTTKLGGMQAQAIKDGDKVILPIEEFGKMVQLELIFKKK